MWHAQLTDIRKLDEAGTRFGFGIVFYNDTKKFVREYTTTTLDDDTIQRTARNEIAALEQSAARKGALTLERGNEIDLTPPEPPVSEPDARAVFATLLRTYQQEQRGVALGLAVKETVSFSELEKLWQPEFVTLL